MNLADIYSTIDALRRKAGDAARNPVDALGQWVGARNDAAGAHLRDLRESSGPGQPGNAARDRVAQAVADAYNPAGITLYHGSPYLFDAFRASKIGTGEGAQMYGRGMYLAEHPSVADTYTRVRNAQSVNTTIGGQPLNKRLRAHKEALALDSYGGDFSKLRDQTQQMRDEFADDLAQAVSRGESPETVKFLAKQLREMDQTLKWQDKNTIPRVEKRPSNLYTVDYPDENLEKSIDYMAPLYAQPGHVRRQIYAMDPKLTHRLSRVPMMGPEVKRLKVEGDLAQADIPGLHFPDQNSRGFYMGGGGPVTRNHVIFPGAEDRLSIVGRQDRPWWGKTKDLPPIQTMTEDQVKAAVEAIRNRTPVTQ